LENDNIYQLGIVLICSDII